MIRLSYVMPVHNRAAELTPAAESLLRQFRSGDELLLVDDGSSDATPAVIGALQAAWPDGIRSLRQRQAGPGAARNAGMALATGDWIGFLDSDDRSLDGALATLRAAIAANPGAGLLAGGRIERGPDGGEAIKAGRPFPAVPAAAFAAFLIDDRRTIGVGAALVRRDVALRCGFPAALPFAEDNAFFARVLASVPAVGIGTPLYRYNLDPVRVRQRAGWDELTPETLIAAIFADLPAEVQALRPRALAAARLAVMRDWHRLGRDREAAMLWRRVLRDAPGLALRWPYLRRYLRGLIGWRHPDACA